MTRIPIISVFIMSSVVFFLCLIPVFHIGLTVGNSWKGIVPEYIEDSGYYYARIHDVVRGNPLAGNPYFLEHKDSMPPAFFVSDWIASIPFIIGTSFVSGVLFNIIFWSEIFVFILYFIFRRLGTTEIHSIIFSLITWLQVFWLFVRPVAMQVIFPGYALFLFALLVWFQNRSTKNTWFVVLATVYCVYLYTYLALIVFFTYFVVFLDFVWTKNYEGLKNLIKLFLSVLVLSIPFLVFTYFQINIPEYGETIRRIGLLLTHVPRMDLYYYGRWIFVVMFLWFISIKWIPSFQSNHSKNIVKFFTITGLGLIIAAGSNIVTGKELELSNHVGRFIIWWFSVSFFVYISTFLGIYKAEIKGLKLYKKAVIMLIVFLCLIGVIRNVQRAFVFFRMDKNQAIYIQNYAAPIKFIQNKLNKENVIVANDDFSNYIPILTNDYVLFHPSGSLQQVSDIELEERYLVSRFFYGNLSRSKIENDIKLYGGAGKVLKGKEMQKEFDAMYTRYNKDIEPNISNYLKKYKVEYIVVDLRNPSESTQLSNLKTIEVYRDKNFVIYRFLP